MLAQREKSDFAETMNWMLLQMHTNPAMQGIKLGKVSPAYLEYTEIPVNFGQWSLPLTRFSTIHSDEWDFTQEAMSRGLILCTLESIPGGRHRAIVRRVDRTVTVLDVAIFTLKKGAKYVHFESPPIEEATIRGAILSTMTTYQLLKDSWQVSFWYSGSKSIAFPTDAVGCRALLCDREPEGPGRRSPLVHWVREHFRKSRIDPLAEKVVREHLRGNRCGTWNKFSFAIVPLNRNSS